MGEGGGRVTAAPILPAPAERRTTTSFLHPFAYCARVHKPLINDQRLYITGISIFLWL